MSIEDPTPEERIEWAVIEAGARIIKALEFISVMTVIQTAVLVGLVVYLFKGHRL